jgi:hypothetical protein
MLYQLPMENMQMGGIYNALKISHLEEIVLHTPWKNNHRGMEKCRKRHSTPVAALTALGTTSCMGYGPF